MSLELEGDFEVDNTPDEVYEFLSDPEKFAPHLPKFEGLQYDEEHPNECTVEVKIGVQNIEGIAVIDLLLVEDDPPNHAEYKGTGSVVAGTVDLTAEFDLEETDSGGTRVHWMGRPDVSGRIVSVAGGLLKPLAQQNVQEAIDAVQEAIES